MFERRDSKPHRPFGFTDFYGFCRLEYLSLSAVSPVARHHKTFMADLYLAVARPKYERARATNLANESRTMNL
jgi:hypothetical protein